MPFIAGQQAAVERRAAAQMGALEAQGVPLKTKLAALQAKRAAAIDVAKTKLGFESEMEKSAYERSKDAATFAQQRATTNRPVEVGGNLVDPATGRIVYQGPAKASEGFTLGEGQKRYDAQGRLVAEGPAKSLSSESFTLGEGQRRYDAQGKLIAEGPAKIDKPPTTADITNFEYAKKNGFIGSLDDWRVMDAALKSRAAGSGADIKNETDLRKEFNNLDAVKQYQELSRAYSGMQQALASSRTAGASKAPADQALITLYNKMLDPGSVVREGEYARSTEGQSAINRVTGYYERLKQGGSGITDMERQDMVNVAQSLFSDGQRAYDQSVNFYTGIAKDYNLDPDRIVKPVGASPSTRGAGAINVADVEKEAGQSFTPERKRKVQELIDDGGTLEQIQQFLGFNSESGQTSKKGPEVQKLAYAIGKYESGNNYQARGPVVPTGRYAGQRALGAYQIMPGNLPQWSKEALGRSVSAAEFLASEDIQDTIAQHRMDKLLQQHGTVEDVASAWFTGQPVAKAGNRKDVVGTAAPTYVKNIVAIYNRT
jgi:hypothetical protein